MDARYICWPDNILHRVDVVHDLGIRIHTVAFRYSKADSQYADFGDIPMNISH